MDILKKIKIKNDFATWITIDSLGKLRFSKSSYYYIVIVPVLAKALEKIKSPVSFIFGDNEFLINIDLPFSWYCFYFGAVAIAIGSLLYQLFCPEIIKNYKNYGEFMASGESDAYLDRTVRKYEISSLYFKFIGQAYIEEKIKETVEIPSMSRRELPVVKERERIVDYKHNIKYQEDRKNMFNELYDNVKLSNKAIRLTSFSLYMIGFSAFGYVILQNIYFVISHLLFL